MSDPLEPHAAEELGGDTEEVDAVLVTPAKHVATSTQLRSVVPAVQAAAVAATGFFAGAAAAGLVRRRRSRHALVGGGSSRRLLGAGGRQRGRGELVQIVGTRSLLVDVHLLGVPGRDR